MKEKIIQSAASQIMKFGFRKFTVDDIASDLGISKKTIYKFFESKKEIISTVVDSYIEKEKEDTLLALKADGNWIDKFKEMICCESAHEKAPPWLVEELQQFFPEEWAKADALDRFKMEQLQILLTQGVEKGVVRGDIHPAIIGMALGCAINGLFDFKFLRQHDLTFNQAMQGVKEIFLQGILENKPVQRGNMDL
ncbi:TetR/AcrR family transcriptional regulator [Desulforamulus ruminis]|uniref:Regulatory protein TetR n=1 Tax=Desulforamulus ruminis (strain ATCC 23193 / DSM 2154 / NCIMB 8452 / DL) TaxID=696281 RepID=F6DSR2_DESRL|nr:TetR/AcrR family transcriptional regulator [Desulforamulus ruminis]AEG58881.1 regulatory protein TetR [Desulforamulus ruminis DSM 2154]